MSKMVLANVLDNPTQDINEREGIFISPKCMLYPHG